MPAPCIPCALQSHHQCTLEIPVWPVPLTHALYSGVNVSVRVTGASVPGEMTFFCCFSDTSLASEASR